MSDVILQASMALTLTLTVTLALTGCDDRTAVRGPNVLLGARHLPQPSQLLHAAELTACTCTS